ncbi:YtxH domain-containing protein [Bacillus sp. 1NLA3E]|uniref:YtxH domain-containing protein n=1 Tax=Bacillus sp. 1NLA3E TaxID=666686 RepID=UPI000318CBAF|nr:YtxH domain-containing protein [Bacillus sp. 1NLA3E]
MINNNDKLMPLNENNERTGTKDFLLGAMVGGVIGASAALWLSPKSRTALRETLNNQTTILKEKADTLQEKVTDLAQYTKEKTNTLTKSLSQQSSEALAKMKCKSSDTESDPVQRMLEETKKAFDETEQKLNR